MEAFVMKTLEAVFVLLDLEELTVRLIRLVVAIGLDTPVNSVVVKLMSPIDAVITSFVWFIHLAADATLTGKDSTAVNSVIEEPLEPAANRPVIVSLGSVTDTQESVQECQQTVVVVGQGLIVRCVIEEPLEPAANRPVTVSLGSVTDIQESVEDQQVVLMDGEGGVVINSVIKEPMEPAANRPVIVSLGSVIDIQESVQDHQKTVVGVGQGLIVMNVLQESLERNVNIPVTVSQENVT
ncbi:uncharacterized protein [Apostichopus japonicus]|uniref:uncharacterized protein isoform X1 n=2 Tax=Stichopus japonicus TaxID=307972 RepID=UPI003AB57076